MKTDLLRLMTPLKAIAVSGTLLLASCQLASVVTSTPMVSPPGAASGAPIPIHGTPYYLPYGKIFVDGSWDSKNSVYNVTVSTDIEPDGRSCYTADLNSLHYPFFDHHAIITADSKQLLKTVDATANDHVVDAAGAIIGAVGEGLQFAASLGKIQTSGSAGESDHPNPFHAILDPYNEVWTADNVDYWTISVTTASKSSFKSAAPLPPTGNQDGILTRLFVPFTVTVKPNKGVGKNLDINGPSQVTVLLPDANHNYLLSVPHAALVTNQTVVQLTSGCLTSIDQTRPSVTLAVFSIPKTILAALLPIPTNTRQAEVTHLESTKTILTDQTAITKLENSH